MRVARAPSYASDVSCSGRMLAPKIQWSSCRSQTRARQVFRAKGPNSQEPTSRGDELERIMFFSSGDAVSMTSRKRKELWPELMFTKEEAVTQQLEALKHNNDPYIDHGVEVLYRFANFDPFEPRTKYFGRSFDLGQFERFRRIMHTSPYAPLLGHDSFTLLSSLELSEHVWKQRVLVAGPDMGGQHEEHVYEFTMVQRIGGWADGYWFTQSLIADGNDWGFMRKHPGIVA